MAPTVPYFRSPRPRGQCASAAITVSSSSSSSSASDQSLVNLSSASFSSSVVILRAPSGRGGGDEARGGQSSAPRCWCPPSPAPSVVQVRSSSSNGSGHAAATTSRRSTAVPYQSPSPCSVPPVHGPGGVLSAHGPGGVVPTSLFSGGDDYDEATSRRKKKYRMWSLEDELKVLSTFAELCEDNLGVPPQASVLLKKIVDDGGLARRGVDAMELADKVYNLKKKFKMTVAKLAANGHRCLRKYRNQVLLRTSMVAWPDLLPRHIMAAVQVQVARAARRRGNNARARL